MCTSQISTLLYIKSMNTIFIISMLFAALATLGVMGLGIFSMIKGGEYNKKHAQKLMRARVMLQGLALGLFALAFLTH